MTGSAGPFSDPSGSGALNFTVNLPSGGTWLLAVELVAASNQQPLALGAAQFDAGNSSGGITLDLGSVSRNCYQTDTWMDPTASSFSFETDTLQASMNPAADINVSPVGNGYQIAAGTTDKIQYLGNGPLVNFAAAPSTETAVSSTVSKSAAGAPVSTLQSGDVYCVQLTGGGHAWMQINNAGAASISGPSFRFRVNTTLPYYAYERTTADTSGVCLTPVYTPTPSATFSPTVTYTSTITPTPAFSSTPTITPTPQPALVLSWNDEPSSQTYLFNQANVTGIQVVLKALGQEPISVTQIGFGLNGSIGSGGFVVGSVKLYPDTPGDDPSANGLYTVSANPTPIASGSFLNGAVTYGGLTNLVVSPGAPQTLLLVMNLNVIGGGNFLNTIDASSLLAEGATSHTPALIYGGPFNGNLQTVSAATATPTTTPTSTVTATWTLSPTYTSTLTPTFSSTFTATNTQTTTQTSTPTFTSSLTTTPTYTNTSTSTPTYTPTSTSSSTMTITPTFTSTSTSTQTSTLTATSTLTTTPTVTATLQPELILSWNDDPASQTYPFNQANVTGIQFVLKALGQESVSVTQLGFGLQGTIGSGQFVAGSVKLYPDTAVDDPSGMGLYVASAPTPITSGSFTSGAVTFAGLTNITLIPNAPQTFLLVMSLNAAAGGDFFNTLDASSILAVGATSHTPAQIYGGPFNGNTQTVLAATATPTVTATNTATSTSTVTPTDTSTWTATTTSTVTTTTTFTFTQTSTPTNSMTVTPSDTPTSTPSQTSTSTSTQTPTLTYTLSPTMTPGGPVLIPDPNLLSAIQTILINNEIISSTSDPIYATELATITSLTADGVNIYNLEGLEYCTGLTYLELEGNNITDLTPLANLTGLQSLDLYGNQVSDITALTGMTGLQTIELDYNQITDLEPLLINAESGNDDVYVSLYGDPLTNSNVPGEVITLISDPYDWNVNFYVNIPDANLLDAIDTALEKDGGEGVTPAEMATITTLTADNAGIASLEGLEYCTALYNLEVESNTITDLTPLTNLTGLQYLDLYDNQVSDLTALSGLTNLNYLELDYNQVTDLGPLVTNAEAGNYNATVYLYDDPLTNPNIANEYATLTNNPYYWNLYNFTVNIPDPNLSYAVQTILLNNGVIEERGEPITPYDMTTITSLTAVADNISNLEGLEWATSLTSLDLQWNNITSLSPLANLTGLTNLNVESNQVTDLTPLSLLTNLTQLDLDTNQITDITVLQNLYQLEYLGLDDNQITDFTPLAGLTNLIVLELSGNQITNIPDRFNLPELTSLYLEYNQIPDLQNLVDGGSLEVTSTLYLDGNPLQNSNVPNEINELMEDGWNVNLSVNIPDPNLLGAIDNVLGYSEGTSVTPADLATITSLTADSAGVTSLTGLEYCTAMTYLELEFDNITDLTPLTNLTGLGELDIYGNQVSNISALAGMTKMTYLEIGDNPIIDITALDGMTSLNAIDLSYDPIQDLQPLVNNTGLGNNDAFIYIYGISSGGSICSEINELEGEGCTVNGGSC